jgi:hypothetical protein
MVSSDNSTGIALYDATGKSRAALTETPLGQATLVFFDANGRQSGIVPDSSRASR